MTIHPLESLYADEVATAVKLFREHHDDDQTFFLRLASMSLKKAMC